MRDLYSDDYESVAGDGADRLIPDGVRKLTGAAVFLGLVAALGLWSYRLGTRDAAEVPIIRAMEGPARIEPADPGGLQAAHQGLEVNAVLAGRPAPLPQNIPPARPEPQALAAEDAPQGELILAAPAALTQQVLGEDADLRMPPEDGPDDLAAAGADPAADADATAELPQAAPGPRPRNRPSNLVVARAKTLPVASTRPAAAPAAAAPPPAPAPAAAAPATREVSGLHPGTRLVQLGAFDSEEITRKAWAQLVARNPDLLGSKSLYVERTTANARVFYRLRVAGFETADQTRQICEALRSRGVACIPVTL